MASVSGASSGSSQNINSSGSDPDLGQIMDQRKRKRMISNRESARRSRMKKQHHLDELSTQVSQLRSENGFILANVNVATQMYIEAESQNSVLRVQVDELTHRLNSLNDIIEFMSSNDVGLDDGLIDGVGFFNGVDFFNPWNVMHANEPILANADMFMF